MSKSGTTALAIHSLESRTAAIAIATLFGVGLVWIGVLLGRVRPMLMAEVPKTPQPGSDAVELPTTPVRVPGPEHLVYSQPPSKVLSTNARDSRDDEDELETVGEPN